MTRTAPTGVRIVLDFELFFKDKRRKCYYYIDFSLNKTVGDVCNGIKSNFNVSEDISLEINGCYVPENEDVRVLYNEDMVRVIDAGRSYCDLPIQNGKHDGQRYIAQDEILSDTLNDKKIKRLDTQEENKSDENPSVSKPKKRKKSRKTDETEGTNEKGIDGSENTIKKKKCATKLVHCTSKEDDECIENKQNKGEPNALNSNAVVHKLSTCKAEFSWKYEDINTEAVPVLKHEGKSFGNVCTTVEFPQVHLDPETSSCVSSASVKTNDINNGKKENILQINRSNADENECLENENRKKRRRRKRKPLRNTDNKCNTVQHITETSVFTKNTFKTPKHIKFDDDDEQNNSSNIMELITAYGNNANDRCAPLQLSVELESQNIDKKHSIKNECDVQSDSTNPIANNTSVVADISDISSNFVAPASSSPMIFECKKSSRLPCNQSEKSVTETQFSKYPLLNSTPKANDIIAFRKWKMDSHYCPGLSGYISAKVLEVSEKDNIVTLRILNGHQELEEPKGKFSLDEENETDGCEDNINDTIEMNCTDLLQVRLMYP